MITCTFLLQGSEEAFPSWRRIVLKGSEEAAPLVEKYEVRLMSVCSSERKLEWSGGVGLLLCNTWTSRIVSSQAPISFRKIYSVLRTTGTLYTSLCR